MAKETEIRGEISYKIGKNEYLFMIMTSSQKTPKAPSPTLPTIWDLCVVVIHWAKRIFVVVHRDLCLFLCGRQLGRRVFRPGGPFNAGVKMEPNRCCARPQAAQGVTTMIEDCT